MPTDYLRKILTARVYDVAQESPLEEAPALDGDFASLSGQEWGEPCNSKALLLREIAAWDAASDEDALKMEKALAEME